MWNKEETACLTGHRPSKLPWFYDEKKQNCIRFKIDLEKLLIKAYEYGLKNYLVGMAEGFDMIAAESLIKIRRQYKDIKIIAAIPCKGQEIKWKTMQQKRYKKILKKCNEVIILSESYTKSCMNDRNKYMIDRSNVVIACFNGQPSGTLNTIKYAKEKGCKIKIININNYVQ